jgi:hypothetical protein
MSETSRRFDHTHSVVPWRWARLFVLASLPLGIVTISYMIKTGSTCVICLASCFGPAVVALYYACVHRLRIWIESSRLHWKHGVKGREHALAVSDIASARVMPIRKFQELGVSSIPYGTFYNAGGRAAVQLTCKDQRVIRLSTNHPEELIAAIEAAR